MKAKLLLILCLALPSILGAQAVDKQKLNSLATAVAHAEGFGVRKAIPTRYHNPGDLKSARVYHPLPGQKHLGKGDHIVFESDKAGWDALRNYLSKMVDGRSHRYNQEMTLAQVAKVYAGNWRPWLKIVAKELSVSPSTKMGELLLCSEPQPPEIESAASDTLALQLLPSLLPPIPAETAERE